MNDDNSRKYFDVARPGRSVPSPTARPVITNTAPQQPDPMMHQQPEVQLNPVETAVTAPAEQPVAPPVTPVSEAPMPASSAAADVVDAHQNFKPLKPTKSRTRRFITLLIVLVVIAVVAVGVYPLIRSKF